MTNTENLAQQSDNIGFLAFLRQYRQPVSYALLAAVPLLALIPIWMIYKYQAEYAPVAVWGAMLALIALACGLALRLGRLEEGNEIEALRGFVLAVGGLSGLVTWLLSLSLAYRWRATLLGGLEAWQGSEGWRLWVCVLTMIAGLALMFLSLLPARAAVHSNVTLRRLVYGYNAALTGLLLLAVLMVANVLIYNYYLTTSFDWTESSIYTLSDQSRNILKSLDKPTKVYALVSRGDDVATREIRTLLDNARAVTDRLRVEYVSPDLDLEKLRDLKSHYQFSDRLGLLLVYGSEGKEDHQFIKYDDIFATDPDRSPGTSRKARFLFKGEDALISALSSLEEGKSRPVIYFMQGNGELDIMDASVAPDGRGAGALRERLQKSNYDVKGLQFSPISGTKTKDQTVITNRVPEDATMVIVAGPRNPVPDYGLKALREYMGASGDAKKKGKLIVLLDLVLDVNKNVVRSGLEDLLAEFNVQAGNDRVVALPNSLNRGNYTMIPVTPDPRARNPVAEAFQGLVFLLPNVQTIKPQPTGAPPSAGRYNAESLLLAPPRYYVWAETNLRADLSRLVEDLLKDDHTKELEQKLSQEPLSVAVIVSESSPTASNDPHAFMRPPDQKPRLAVFGGSTFASNMNMNESRGSLYFSLFSSTVAWLRERPSNIGLEPKRRNVFVLNVGEDVIRRMIFLPLILTLSGIVGVGAGVWLVRRR
jgi:hypothetical protein